MIYNINDRVFCEENGSGVVITSDARSVLVSFKSVIQRYYSDGTHYKTHKKCLFSISELRDNKLKGLGI